MDILDITRIAFALVAVLGMIGLTALVARKTGLANAGLGGRADKRLAIVETLNIDARRRIAIIRCDNAEHLIIIGANGETVIGKTGMSETVAPIETVSADDEIEIDIDDSIGKNQNHPSLWPGHPLQLQRMAGKRFRAILDQARKGREQKPELVAGDLAETETDQAAEKAA